MRAILTREEVEQSIGLWAPPMYATILLSHDAAQRERIAELEARLEIDYVYDSQGQRIEVPVPERSRMIDGIACRDATIRLQDARIRELEAPLREYRGV